MGEDQGGRLPGLAAGLLQLPAAGVPIFHQIADTAQFKTGQSKFLTDPGNSRPFHVLAQPLVLPGQHLAAPGRAAGAADRDKGSGAIGNHAGSKRPAGSCQQFPAHAEGVGRAQFPAGKGFDPVAETYPQITQDLAVSQADIQE